ncbi:hypothetical protein Patl1_04596 [Pistacia atlantica]|uniref:Uncharacterized protein n=1 Tax=Pistacia atlantica TaxID=434234 RepID=A0ACC1BRK7_9ROSI|nr:hypothetical protein Patl1_04596 [Pistacia atlantica]
MNERGRGNELGRGNSDGRGGVMGSIFEALPDEICCRNAASFAQCHYQIFQSHAFFFFLYLSSCSCWIVLTTSSSSVDGHWGIVPALDQPPFFRLNLH